MFEPRWTCADKRFLISTKTPGVPPAEYIEATCTWYTNYTYSPANLQCVLTYCSNATTEPNTKYNYNLVLGGGKGDINYNTLGLYGDRTPLNKSIFYPCLNYNWSSNYYRLENLTDFKQQADTGITVSCGPNGLYNYPAVWPPCSINITCQDPGLTSDLQLQAVPKTPTNMSYLSQMSFSCTDPRKYVKIAASSNAVPAASITTTCLWRKLYNVTASQLSCTLHHCGHPYTDPGGFSAPPDANNLLLVEDARLKNSNVPFSSYITFNCSSGMYIESNQTEPSRSQVFVQCLPTVATYNIPPLTSTYVYNMSVPAAKTYVGGAWPNCTATIVCGQPPPMPVNGTITWLYDSVQYQVSAVTVDVMSV